MYTSSQKKPPEVFCKKNVIKNWENPHEKVSGLKTYNFIKKILQCRCFLVKFSKIVKKFISKNICELVKAPQKNKSIAFIRKTFVRQ